MTNPSARPLEEEILKLLKAKGPITFFEFMDLALYHPSLGFYASSRRGPGTDYRTSPTLTPSFGHLLAGALNSMKLDLKTDFINVVELGGGTGHLAAAVLEKQPEIRWTFVERTLETVEVQRRATWGGRGCSWVKDLEELDPFVGCLLANEVLDNFPVHIIEKQSELLEIFVTWEGGLFVEVPMQVSSEHIRERAEAIATSLPEGSRFEIRPGVETLTATLDQKLLRGYVLFIDYGDDAPALQIANPAGTVVTYRAEVLGGDPLSSPGSCDITASVDFSHLRGALKSRGFDPIQIVTQAEFLETIGLRSLEESVEKQRRAALSEGRHSDFVSLTAEKGRLHALRAPGGMGEFKVLIASRNAPSVDLRG